MIKINFLEESKYKESYYKKIENWILNSHSLSLNISIVGNMYMKKINEGMFNEKEVVEDLEIKFFKLLNYENEVLTYQEIFLDKVQTDEKQLRIW